MEKGGWFEELTGKRYGGAVPTAEEPARAAHAPPTAFMRQRIRDRFLGSRFPGLPHDAEHFGRTDETIRVARLFLEDGDIARACEWLDFASDANPDERLWLAHLEILYVTRQAKAFAALAAQGRGQFPGSGKWDDIVSLGARLAPDDPLFAGAQAASSDNRYGAWPQMLNWIEAPFDLTSNVLAAEFHAAMQA